MHDPSFIAYLIQLVILTSLQAFKSTLLLYPYSHTAHLFILVASKQFYMLCD